MFFRGVPKPAARTTPQADDLCTLHEPAARAYIIMIITILIILLIIIIIIMVPW